MGLGKSCGKGFEKSSVDSVCGFDVGKLDKSCKSLGNVGAESSVVAIFFSTASMGLDS